MNHIDQYLDEIGQVMVKELLKRKQKLENKERIVKQYKRVIGVITTVFFIYVSFVIVIPHQTNYGFVITLLVTNPYHYFIIGVIFTLYHRLIYLNKKKEKAENEYHALRCEFIQRTVELQGEEEERAKLYDLLKWLQKRYDVNLYYENE